MLTPRTIQAVPASMGIDPSHEFPESLAVSLSLAPFLKLC